jgi:peptidoglycan/xylan/chitin deacetylase (PgdA/CDA1 family)
VKPDIKKREIMKTFFVILLTFLTLLPVIEFAQSNRNKVAITIDDLPIAAGARKYPVVTQKQIIDKLVASLKKTNAPIIGFVNENQLYTDSKVNEEKVDLLRTWLAAGFDLGNHTYTHKSANQVSVEEYEKDILDGEKICKQLVKKYGKEFIYFRHPFLQTGRSLEVKHEIESFLRKNGYTIAPVTIDNSEWIYAAAYEKAFSSGNTDTTRNIAREYLDYMKSKVEWYEKKSVELFGRNISHILLIHANRLNADHVSELCEMLSERNYGFITAEEALKDEAYKSNDTFIKAGGISWIDRWALTAGKTKEFFSGEPRAAKWIMNYAGIESE